MRFRSRSPSSHRAPAHHYCVNLIPVWNQMSTCSLTFQMGLVASFSCVQQYVWITC